MTFLRPVYTAYLFKQLQKQLLNVYGTEGQGKERLLVDLQELAKPAGTLVLLANMKAFVKNYAGFILDPQFGIAFFDTLNALKKRLLNCYWCEIL